MSTDPSDLMRGLDGRVSDDPAPVAAEPRRSFGQRAKRFAAMTARIIGAAYLGGIAGAVLLGGGPLAAIGTLALCVGAFGGIEYLTDAGFRQAMRGFRSHPRQSLNRGWRYLRGRDLSAPAPSVADPGTQLPSAGQDSAPQVDSSTDSTGLDGFDAGAPDETAEPDAGERAVPAAAAAPEAAATTAAAPARSRTPHPLTAEQRSERSRKGFETRTHREREHYRTKLEAVRDAESPAEAQRIATSALRKFKAKGPRGKENREYRAVLGAVAAKSSGLRRVHIAHITDLALRAWEQAGMEHPTTTAATPAARPATPASPGAPAGAADPAAAPARRPEIVLS